MTKLKLIACDLDGTLCDIRHRQHLAKAASWDEFHALLHRDTPREGVLRVLELFYEDIDFLPLFLTGRPEDYRTQTVSWLSSECGLEEFDDYDLLMRPRHDFRSDGELKLELLEAHREECGVRQDEVLILDDRDQVVAHFRDAGYECWQVAEGVY